MEIVESKLENYNLCNTCKIDLGDLNIQTPVYCASCIEEMGRLNLTPNRYRRLRALRQA